MPRMPDDGGAGGGGNVKVPLPTSCCPTYTHRLMVPVVTRGA